FAHHSRLMVVCALVDGERSVRDLEDTLGIRQPGLSQQIAELRDAGLIVGRKELKNMFYRLADGRVKEFIEQMHRMFWRAAAIRGWRHTMTEFTPWASLIGGAMIGLSAVLLMLWEGRIAGISGIAGRLLPPYC